MTDEGIVAFGDGGGEGFLVEGTGLSKVSFFTIIAELGKGGKATPVFIGTSMIILAGLLLAAEFLSRNSILKTEKIEGSLPRRIIFVGLMIVWVSFLPYLGFLISSILAFALISAAVPRKEKWSLSPFCFHAAAGVVTTAGFWVVLTTLLNVPSPELKIF